MIQNTSIDKIKISTSDFVINQIDTFGVNSHNKQPNQPISDHTCCVLSNGTSIPAQNVYLHGDTVPYHLNIKPARDGIIKAWLEFNPSKIDKSITNVIELIDEDLRSKHDFVLNWDSSVFSRLDIAKDNHMNHLARFYHDPKKHLAKSRYHKDKNEYPNSLLYKTTKWQVCDYDKGMKNEKDDGNKKPTSSNFLRSEIRLMTPQYIEKHIGSNKLHTLIDMDQHDIENHYVQTQQKFLQELNDIAIKDPMESVSDVYDLMPYLMTIRNKKQRMLMYISTTSTINTLSLRHNYIEALHEYIDTREWKSKQAKSNFKNRELKTLDEVLRSTNVINQKRSKDMEESLKTKINEYKSKFLVA